MNKVIVISLFIMVFLAGILVGITAIIFYKDGNANQQVLEENSQAENIVKILSSDLVPSITVYGQIADIQGRNIILSLPDDTMTILVKDEAKISTIKISADGLTSNNVEVDFSSIKRDDNVSVNTKLLSDGSLEGTAVFIFPEINIFTP